jgi:predicted 2-oxoglutarate/Fe(II)-dependent dioxygenase YbiX
MGLQDKLADARKAAERARAQQQEWSQGRHEAKEQHALAKQETEAQEKATVDARVAVEGWWTHPDAEAIDLNITPPSEVAAQRRSEDFGPRAAVEEVRHLGAGRQ